MLFIYQKIGFLVVIPDDDPCGRNMLTYNGKGKVTLEQATKAQRESRGIALLLL
jgi:hypothetical protein